MKILYHHRTRSTDAQRIHILELVEALQALGHTVDIVSLVPIDAEQNDAARDAGEARWKQLVRRIPFTYEAVQLGYNLVGFPMIVARLLTGPVDFVYERYSLFNFAGVLAARLFGKKIILEVNSPLALEQARDGDIRLRGFASWTERVICNLATRVIVVSGPLRRILEAAGVQSGKLEVMSNGVSTGRFPPGTAPAGLRKSLGLEGYIVAGFVGWFRKWHGLELLLEAFLRSGLAAERVKILLIGDGPAMPDLRQFVDVHGLKESVVFTGPLPHAQVPPFLDLIDIAVQPAANEYCCPMKILEYMALGKPIVAPAQENIQELLSQDEAQFFIPRDAASFAKALRTLATDPQRARGMGHAARTAIFRRGLLWSANARRVVEMAAPRNHRRGIPLAASERGVKNISTIYK